MNLAEGKRISGHDVAMFLILTHVLINIAVFIVRMCVTPSIMFPIGLYDSMQMEHCEIIFTKKISNK